MRLLKRVFWISIILLATVFAFTNMHDVRIVLDPLGLGIEAIETMEIPLAYVILASVALGLIVGVGLAWDAYRPTRRALNAERREAHHLRRENERFVEALKTADHPESAGPPAARF